jgi:hypothetical protein
MSEERKPLRAAPRKDSSAMQRHAQASPPREQRT